MALQLKPEVKSMIQSDQELQLKIAKKFHKRNIVTVQRWVKGNHPLLTEKETLDIIRDHCNLSQEVELTLEEKEKAAA